MKKVLIALTITFLSSLSSFAFEDIVGTISKIVVLRNPAAPTKTSIHIYFSSIVNDRYGCAANPGYAEITDNTAQVPTFLMNQLYSQALTAYSTGSKYGLDFYNGVCSGGGIGYIHQ
jgi:hypothetical protein